MSQGLQDISNLIRNETAEGGNTKERIASAFDTVNIDKLDSGGTTKTGAQLDSQFSSVFSLVVDPSASFTPAQILTLKAIKDIRIYNGDPNTKYVIQVLAINDAQGRYYLRLTELNEAGNIFHTIYLNHDNNITWSEYTNQSGTTFKVLVNMTGLSGNVLNDSQPSNNMILSPYCFIVEKTDVEIFLADKNHLTNNRYINISGGVSNTSGEISATLDFMPVIGGTKLYYYGYFGSSNTRIAFYDASYTAIEIYPTSNQIIQGELILNVPANASYVRATTYDNYLNQFKLNMIVKKSIYDDWLYLMSEDYSVVGNINYDANGVLVSANIEWSSGNTGIITYSDFDENAFAYRKYEATNIQLGRKVVQPPVTFSDNGALVFIPGKIIRTI